MKRPKLLPALVISLVTLLVALPAGALGAGPDRVHEHFDDLEADVDVCGVNVDVHARGVFTDLVFFDKEGNFRQFKSLSSGRVTFTADDGRQVIQHFAGAFVVEEVIDEAAGTLTLFFTFVGLPNQLRAAHGPVVLQDVGLITFAEVHDLETGDILSFEIVNVRGPHPEADSGFTIFCDRFLEALG